MKKGEKEGEGLIRTDVRLAAPDAFVVFCWFGLFEDVFGDL